jgi:hypothetical protein
MIPLKKESPDYLQMASFVSISIIAGILIRNFQNIYLLAAFLFSIFWINILLFGSQSETLIHLLFASQYNSWEGFLLISKGFDIYLLPAQLIIILLIIFPAGLLRQAKIKKEIVEQNIF